jgi:DNA-binding CsgD family transcriptional regulator
LQSVDEMGLLTAFERKILELRSHDLSDYAIARELDKDPPTVYKSRKNAHKKLREAKKDLEWAKQLGLPEKLESKPTKEPTLRAAF